MMQRYSTEVGARRFWRVLNGTRKDLDKQKAIEILATLGGSRTKPRTSMLDDSNDSRFGAIERSKIGLSGIATRRRWCEEMAKNAVSSGTERKASTAQIREKKEE